MLVHVTHTRVKINPLLEPPPEDIDRPHLKWNMLFESNDCQRSTDPNHISWSAGRDDPATYPRLSSLRLVSESLPWVFEVVADNKAIGVTCGEVIEKISQDLHRFTSKDDFEHLSSTKKAAVYDAYTHNRSREPGVPGGRLKQPMLRLDFLIRDTVYGGIYDDPTVVKKALGATPPCTFVMKCVKRYAMTAEEARDQEARQRVLQDEGRRRSHDEAAMAQRRRSATVETVTDSSTSDDD